MSGLNGENFDQQGGLEVFDLTDMDELETKLDLAKAYIDMSDMDAARIWLVKYSKKVRQSKKNSSSITK